MVHLILNINLNYFPYIMIEPILLTHTVKKQVCKNDSKKYYRFRKTHFYGGCATADCVGCNLRCVYCWAQKKVWYPQKFGKFYSPESVAERLLKMKQPLIRVNGGEPTIGKDHLLKLLSYVPENVVFILETNGLLLDEEYVKELSKFKNLYVRVSLKGVDEQTFEQNTGADGRLFNNQLNALAWLKKFGVRHRAALLYNIYTKKQINSLGISDLEYEALIKYDFVLQNLRKNGIGIVNE